jgi:hypothetical protein
MLLKPRITRKGAEKAVSRGAYPDALGLSEAALKRLDELPEEDQRLKAELELRTIQSVVAVILHGGGSNQRENAVKQICELASKTW